MKRIVGFLLVLSGLTVISPLASRGAAKPPPSTAYMEPHPVPVPDAVADAFVRRVAPGLHSVSDKQIAAGIVIAKSKSAAKPRKIGIARSAAKARKIRIAMSPLDGKAPAVGVDAREVFARAGAGRSGRPNAGWIILLSAALALGGLGVWGIALRRPSPGATE